MKRLLKGIILTLVALVVVVVGGAYLIPPVAVVERTTVIAASPDKVYAVIASMKRFNEWSPWTDLDPGLTYTFEGPEQGPGQKMSWKSGNPQVGSGSVTITEAVPNEKVTTELDFGEMGKSQSVLTLSTVSGGTLVKWVFSAESNGILNRWVSLMFDSWIGGDYVKGLARLKALVESDAPATDG